MLSSLPETRMRWLRRLFVGGWLLLIGSLFWDPFSAWLTTGQAGVSPWRPMGEVRVQGELLAYAPYPIATQIFWGILVPLIPLGMMVFGHEVWRRICPLSALMQLPRRLGIQVRRKQVDARTGAVSYQVPTLSADGWLARNHWYVQFGLLTTFLAGRLLFFNSDRLSLGLFFIFLIVAAVAVGLLYGGKTWCNYVCPMAPVQKIFSEPGSLLSQSHQPLPMMNLPVNSMCRTEADGVEVSDCVGCISNCPDIDPERHYWRDLGNPGRRFVYFGYFGLVAGFYLYYFLYAGNWNYYLSGAWTHTVSQLAELTGPGFYLNGQPIAIPKWLAVPLTLLVCIGVANGLWRGVSWGIRRTTRLLTGREGDPRVALHRTFCLLVFSTINVYYLFSGKPFLRGLPSPVEGGMTALVLGVSCAWLWRMWQRRPEPYLAPDVVRHDGVVSP